MARSDAVDGAGGRDFSRPLYIEIPRTIPPPPPRRDSGRYALATLPPPPPSRGSYRAAFSLRALAELFNDDRVFIERSN